MKNSEKYPAIFFACLKNRQLQPDITWSTKGTTLRIREQTFSCLLIQILEAV